MRYSLYIKLNTFVEQDKVSIEGITLPKLHEDITISQIILELDGWEFGEEFAEEFDYDYGDLNKKDVLRLYNRWCEIYDNEIEQEFVDIINNAEFGFKHGSQYFTFLQSY
jgi:hypothetical protein